MSLSPHSGDSNSQCLGLLFRPTLIFIQPFWACWDRLVLMEAPDRCPEKLWGRCSDGCRVVCRWQAWIVLLPNCGWFFGTCIQQVVSSPGFRSIRVSRRVWIRKMWEMRKSRHGPLEGRLGALELEVTELAFVIDIYSNSVLYRSYWIILKHVSIYDRLW